METRKIHTVDSITIRRHVNDRKEGKTNSYLLDIKSHEYGVPDTGTSFTLCRENGSGWTKAYTQKVIRKILKTNSIDLFRLKDF